MRPEYLFQVGQFATDLRLDQGHDQALIVGARLWKAIGDADIAVGDSDSLGRGVLYTISSDRTKVTRIPPGGFSEDITYNLPTTNGIYKIGAGYNLLVVLIGEEVWLLLDALTQWTNITDGLKVKEVFAAGNSWGVYKQALYSLTTDNTLYRYDGF